jgi:uncharacterized membrane protein
LILTKNILYVHENTTQQRRKIRLFEYYIYGSIMSKEKIIEFMAECYKKIPKKFQTPFLIVIGLIFGVFIGGYIVYLVMNNKNTVINNTITGDNNIINSK